MNPLTTDSLSNRGRRGVDDEVGSLNMMTAEIIKNAAGLVKRGKAYSLNPHFSPESKRNAEADR